MTTVSTPTTTNGAAQVGDTVVTGILNTAVDLGLKAIYVEVPFLAFPGLKQIFEMLVNWIVGFISKQLQLLVTFTVIDVQVGMEKSDFKKALDALKAAQAGGNKDDIAKALEAFQVAAQNLTHSDGSTPPR